MMRSHTGGCWSRGCFQAVSADVSTPYEGKKTSNPSGTTREKFATALPKSALYPCENDDSRCQHGAHEKIDKELYITNNR